MTLPAAASIDQLVWHTWASRHRWQILDKDCFSHTFIQPLLSVLLVEVAKKLVLS